MIKLVFLFVLSVLLQGASSIQSMQVDTDTGRLVVRTHDGTVKEFNSGGQYAQVRWDDLTQQDRENGGAGWVSHTHSMFQSNKTYSGIAVVETSNSPQLTVKNLKPGKYEVWAGGEFTISNTNASNTGYCRYGIWDGTTRSEVGISFTARKTADHTNPAETRSGGPGILLGEFEYFTLQTSITFEIQTIGNVSGVSCAIGAHGNNATQLQITLIPVRG